jgi:wobble nucleotide-excising tRNase
VIDEIIKLRGIGLLHDSLPNGPQALSKAVAIYSDSGRGKSTFSALLRSLSDNDCQAVLARQTLRAEVEPYAEVLIGDATHTLSHGSWDKTYEGVRVFDDDFVEKNVSLGSLVALKHLEHLLVFALGEDMGRPTEVIEDVLEEFRDGVNSRLRQLGADFEFATFERSGAEGTPRVKYTLRLMGSEVPLVGAEPGSPSFSTALSPGDRRLLALALFFCNLDGDPDLPGDTLVFDDPASGLDKRRTTRVADAVMGFAGRAQVVVLSRDAEFIRMLRDRGFDSVLQFRRSGAYCAIEDCDIDAVCATDYVEHHEELDDWRSGGHPM